MQNGCPVDIVHFQFITEIGDALQHIRPGFARNAGNFAAQRPCHASEPIEQMQPRPFARLVIDLALQMLGELLG